MQNHMLHFRKEVRLSIHRMAVGCSAMEDKHRVLFIASRLTHCGIPQVHAGGEIKVTAFRDIRVKWPESWVPVPARLRRIVARRWTRNAVRSKLLCWLLSQIKERAGIR